MKKALSLLLTFILVLSLATSVSAVGVKEYLGDISFNVADGFEKIDQQDTSVSFQNPSEPHQTIVLTMIKGFFEGMDSKNIADIDESALKQVIDNIMTEENLSTHMTERNGVYVNAEITDKTTGLKETTKNLPVYMYEVNYTGTASGYIPYYGHYVIAIFGNYDDMYMFEMDKKQGENDANSDFIEMLNTVAFSGGSSSNSDAIKITVDGEYITPDSDPTIVNDRTLVPIRAVAEKLGYNVNWIAETRTAVISNGEVILRVTIDSPEMIKETKEEVDFVPEFYTQEKIELDVSATIINDRTYLPLRAVGEALGCNVDWDASSRTVIITSK